MSVGSHRTRDLIAARTRSIMREQWFEIITELGDCNPPSIDYMLIMFVMNVLMRFLLMR